MPWNLQEYSLATSSDKPAVTFAGFAVPAATATTNTVTQSSEKYL